MPHLVLSYLGILVNHYVKKVLFLLLFRWRLPFFVIGRFALVVSPETLPEKRIKERELGDYVEKAKKTKDKYV